MRPILNESWPAPRKRQLNDLGDLHRTAFPYQETLEAKAETTLPLWQMVPWTRITMLMIPVLLGKGCILVDTHIFHRREFARES